MDAPRLARQQDVSDLAMSLASPCAPFKFAKNAHNMKTSTQWLLAAYQPKLVSVVMPTRNRPALTLKAAQSVLTQTYRPLELIVVDDGSTDDTVSVLQDWASGIRAAKDFKVSIIKQRMQGAPVARNTGCAAAHGEFIQFLDSDDILHPEKIQIQADALQNYSNYNFALCKYTQVTTEWTQKRGTVESPIALEFIDEVSVFTVPKTVWCCLYRREIIDANGPWNSELVRWQDWEYTSRMYCHQKLKAIFIPCVLYYFRQHSEPRIGNVMHSPGGIAPSVVALKTIENNVEITCSWTAEGKRRFAKFYENLAVQAMRHGQSDQAKVALLAAKRLSNSALLTFKLSLLSAVSQVLGAAVCAKCMLAYNRMSKWLKSNGNEQSMEVSRFEG